jgi:hypothetical protein
MNMIHIGIVLIAIVAIIQIVTMVMNFLGVDIQFYGSYLLWIIAIILLWSILPQSENYFV